MKKPDIFKIGGPDEPLYDRAADDKAAALRALPPGATIAGPLPIAEKGRPRALDESAKRLLGELISHGYTFKEAAAYVACSPRTIRRERKRDPKFDAELKRAADVAGFEPKEVVIQAAKTNWRAAAWLMKFLQSLGDRDAKRRQERRKYSEGELVSWEPGQPAPFREDPDWFKSDNEVRQAQKGRRRFITKATDEPALWFVDGKQESGNSACDGNSGNDKPSANGDLRPVAPDPAKQLANEEPPQDNRGPTNSDP